MHRTFVKDVSNKNGCFIYLLNKTRTKATKINLKGCDIYEKEYSVLQSTG